MARAPIIGETLRWARQVGQVERRDLAHAAGVSSERLEEFERETESPTFRQLTLMATKLDRPLGFFFAPAPASSDMPHTADFRGRNEGEVPGDLAREMRRATQHRETMLELGGGSRRDSNLQQFDWDDVARQAARLRESFGLTPTFTPPESQLNQVFNFWRGLLEEHGVLVFQTTRISLKTFRGLSIHHDQLPIVLVNGADSPAGRCFTLFHEVAHLSNRTSGLCALNDHVFAEALANSFAAHFLMPEEPFRRAVGNVDDPEEASDAMASRFKVSSLAAAVRLRTLNLIDDDDLDEVRSISDDRWERVREQQKRSDGFVPPWRLRYRDLGPAYIGTVAKALEDRRIDIVDATYLLNARVPMVEDLLSEFYRSGGAQE